MKWRFEKLENLVQIKGGKRLPRGEDFSSFPTNHPYIRARDIGDGKIKMESPVYISEETFRFIKNYTVRTNDIVITIVGANIGDIGFITQEFNGANLTENAVRIFPKHENELSPIYLKYSLLSDTQKHQLQQIAAGAAQGKLGLYKIKDFQIPLPPLPTQQKIAAILSAYDDLIENNLKRIRLLEEAAQHLYREWFVRFRFPGWEGVRWVEGLPEGWERKAVSEAIEYHIGGGWGQDEFQGDFMLPAYVIRGTDIPKLQQGNSLEVPFRFHTKSNLSSRKLQEGDLVFEVSGGSKGQPVGRSLLITSKTLDHFGANDVICASFCKLLRVKKAVFSPYHLDAFIKESYTDGTLAQYENQSASNIINFRFNDFLSRVEITVPPKHILEAFENVLTPIKNQIAVLGFQNQKLKEARDLLLPRLMNGTIEL